MLPDILCLLLLVIALGLRRGSPGFSAGILVAASIWCLIIPAMEASVHMGRWAFLPAFAGVWCGFALFQALEQHATKDWRFLLLFMFLLGRSFLPGVSAGAMLYLVVQKLVPEMSRRKHPDLGTLQFAAGFTLVMVLSS